MNVLIKTTFNRSPGDDLARRGTLNLLGDSLHKHNVFVYDAGKDMSKIVRRTLEQDEEIQTDIWHVDRDVKIDLIIFAGSPVWTGGELIDLEDYIIENRVPCYYLGVGTNSSVGSGTKETLRNCKLFISRDYWGYETARKYGCTIGQTICCPSIFSFSPIRILGDKIGIVVQMDCVVKEQLKLIHSFSPETVKIITHHIEDYELLSSTLSNYEVRYSRFIDHLVSIYKECNSIYSMRIHGSFLAFSLGIPTVCMKDVKKSRMCNCLGIEIKSPEKVEMRDLISYHKIIEKRMELKVKYEKALEGLIKCLK